MRFLDNVVKDDDKTELINSFSTLAKSRCVTISDQQLITDYIGLLEHGTERMAAKPWAAPGYMQSRSAALATVVAEMQTGLAAAIKKAARLAKKNAA